MFKSGQHNEWSLQEMLAVLMDFDQAEFNELRFVARMIVTYFRQPMHEITIDAIKDGLRLFPLFLYHERVPHYTIQILVNDAERLLSKAKEIQRQHVSEQQTVNCLMRGSENEPGHSDQNEFEDMDTNHNSVRRVEQSAITTWPESDRIPTPPQLRIRRRRDILAHKPRNSVPGWLIETGRSH